MPNKSRSSRRRDRSRVRKQPSRDRRNRILVVVLLVGLVIAVITMPESGDVEALETAASPVGRSQTSTTIPPAIGLSEIAELADLRQGNSVFELPVRSTVAASNQAPVWLIDTLQHPVADTSGTTNAVSAIYGGSRGRSVLWGEQLVHDRKRVDSSRLEYVAHPDGLRVRSLSPPPSATE